MSAVVWESNDSGHRAILRSASDFQRDTFRSKSYAKGVVLILGKMEDATVLAVQSVAFDKEHFETASDAKKWWSENGDAVDKTYDSRTGTPLDSKAIQNVGITKRLVTVQSMADATGEIKAPQQPTTSQLDLINQYTRSPKTANDVAVFPVLAMNDVIDRDVDRFPTQAVHAFMNLSGPLSPIGKSFMVGHDTRQLPVGRIFDGEVMQQSQVTWLKLWTYIPNTPQYADYLESVDYGIYWAVSVGVLLGGAMCSVGEPHEWGWHPYVCSMGHEKGERYDPESQQMAEGSRMLKTDPSGALCWRDLVDPQDFYELSQVYLGAQYAAAYDDKLVTAGVSKSVTMGSGTSINVYSLKSEETEELPRIGMYPSGSHIAAVADAGGEILLLEDGDQQFVVDGLLYNFTPITGEELCLGKAEEHEQEDKQHQYVDDGTGHCQKCGMSQAQHGAYMPEDPEDKGATGSTSFPLSERDRSWDSGAAEGRVRSWAGATDAPNAKYRSAHFWYDSSAPDQYGSYKLPFVDVINSNATAVWRSITTCAAIMQGSQGGVSVPDADRAGIKSKIEAYYAKARSKYNDDTIQVPWQGKQANAAQRLLRCQLALAQAIQKQTDETPADLIAALDALIDEITDELEMYQDVDTALALLTAADQVVDSLMEMLGIPDTDEGEDTGSGEPSMGNMMSADEEDELKKEAVLESIKAVGMPSDIVDAADAADGNGLDEALKAASDKIASLVHRAQLGDEYVHALRADAVHWFTMSQRDPQNPEKGVDTSKFERMLTLCGDDTELLKEQIEMYRSLARTKFPEAVRRSTFPMDPNTRPEGLEEPNAVEAVDTSGIKRIHG